MSKTADQMVTAAMRLLNAIDAAETPAATELQQGREALSDLLRAQHSDAASTYLIERHTFTLPAQQSQFIISMAADADLKRDAVVVRDIWANDTSPNVNRPVYPGSEDEVVRTTSPGIPTKWFQERRADGGVRVTVWQMPRVSCPLLISVGERVPELPTGDTVVPLPPEATTQAEYLLAMRCRKQWGVALADIQDVLQIASGASDEWMRRSRGVRTLRMMHEGRAR